MVIFLLLAGAFAFYIMNTEERNRVMRWIVAASVVLRRLAVLLLAGLGAWGRAIHARNRLAQAAAIVLLFVASLGTIVLTRPGPADVRPEIERLLAVESQTTAIYDAAAAQFRRGTLDSESLARVIERKIKPELQGVRVRVMSLDNIRSDQEPMLEKARERSEERRVGKECRSRWSPYH